MRDQVAAALAGATYEGWDGLLTEQRTYLDAFWDSADVEVDGDPVVQQAVRFGLFHVLQAGARCERRAIASKACTRSRPAATGTPSGTSSSGAAATRS